MESYNNFSKKFNRTDSFDNILHNNYTKNTSKYSRNSSKISKNDYSHIKNGHQVVLPLCFTSTQQTICSTLGNHDQKLLLCEFTVGHHIKEFKLKPEKNSYKTSKSSKLDTKLEKSNINDNQITLKNNLSYSFRIFNQRKIKVRIIKEDMIFDKLDENIQSEFEIATKRVIQENFVVENIDIYYKNEATKLGTLKVQMEFMPDQISIDSSQQAKNRVLHQENTL